MSERSLNRTLLNAPRRNLAIGVLLAIMLVSAAVFGFRYLTGGSASSTTATEPVGVAGLAQSFPQDELTVAIGDPPPGIGADATITVLNADSGAILGQVTAGYLPWVVLRLSQQQLIVAQKSGPGRETREATLRVFSLADLTAPPTVIPIPARSQEIIYSPGMILSADEQILYYTRYQNLCRRGGDASVCDQFAIGAIDVDSGAEVGHANLALGCALPTLVAHGDSGALAMCPAESYSLHVIDAKGAGAEVATFPRRGAGAFAMGSTAEGRYYVLYKDGAVLLEGDDSPVTDLLASDHARIGFSTRSAVGSDWALFAYQDPSDNAFRFEDMYDGVVVYRTSDPTEHYQFATPFRFLHVSSLGSGKVGLLRKETGQIHVLDMTTGRLDEGNVPVPDRTQWLVGD